MAILPILWLFMKIYGDFYIFFQLIFMFLSLFYLFPLYTNIKDFLLSYHFTDSRSCALVFKDNYHIIESR